jgi:hypothetical protein
MRKIICLGFFFIFLSCENEKIVKKTEYIEIEKSWKEHNEIEYDLKYLLNSSLLNDNMLIIGAENYAIIDSNNNVKNWNLFEYQYSYQRRPHCSDDLVVFFGDRIDSEIEIRYKKYWSIDKSSAFIDFRQVDSTFLNFASSR